MAFHITSSFVTTSFLLLAPFFTRVYKNSTECCQERQQMLLVRIKPNSWATGEVTPTTFLRRTPSKSPKLSDAFSVALTPKRHLSIASVSHCFSHSKKSIGVRRPIAPGDSSKDRKIASHALQIKTVTVLNPFNWKISSSRDFHKHNNPTKPNKCNKTSNVNLRKPQGICNVLHENVH